VVGGQPDDVHLAIPVGSVSVPDPGRRCIRPGGRRNVVSQVCDSQHRRPVYRHLLARPDSAEPGTFEARTNDYIDRTGADRVALGLVLDTLTDTPAAALATVEGPSCCSSARTRTTRGSVDDLAAAFPDAIVRRVPGDHATAPRSPQFAAELVDFLAD
jgi:hypothetical protein